MSVVLCLPAHLCVSPQRPVAGPPRERVTIMNCISKRPGVPEVSALRPICWQNSMFRWFTGTLLLLLEDFISFVTPKEQKAFIRGRSILDHISGSRGAWDHYTVGAFLTVDFAKAYDGVQRAYMCAILEYPDVDQALIALLIQLLRAPFVFAVGRGVFWEEKVYPRSGVRHGDPLSLALFVLLFPIDRSATGGFPFPFGSFVCGRLACAS